MEYKPRGRTFDELNIGDEVVTFGRTITETDVVNFAGISGDFHPEHTNEEYGRKSPLHGRIAHGLLVTAISTGMVNQTGITEGTTIAVLEMKQRFLKPVRFGDTIKAIFKIVDKRDTKKTDRGIVFAGLTVINQIEEIVLEGEIVIMLYRKGYPQLETGKRS
jgi:acyl dehydratase